MPSDIPEDGLPSLVKDKTQGQPDIDREAKNIRDSMGLDALNASEGFDDIDGPLDEATDFEDFDGGASSLLMAHERKLPIAEQRQIVMARRKTDDDDDDEERERSGAAPRRRTAHLPPEDRTVAAQVVQIMYGGRGRWRDGDRDRDSETGANTGTSGGTAVTAAVVIDAATSTVANTDTSPVPLIDTGAPPARVSTAEAVAPYGDNKNSEGSGTGGGSRIEAAVAPLNDATTTGANPDRATAGAATAFVNIEPRVEPSPASSIADGAVANPGQTAATTTAQLQANLLNDEKNPNNGLFNAALQGVTALDPSKVLLNKDEQVNLAAALTANMSNNPNFDRLNPNPANISIAASEAGDRVFAINNQNPGAPNAVYTSVDVNQARAQPLEVSSAQALPPPPVPAPDMQQALTQQQMDNTPSPRAIG